MSELAILVGSVRPTVSRAVNALERRGLLVRDGRQLRLTTAGRAEVELVGQDAVARLPKAARLADRTAKLASAVPSTVGAARRHR